MMIKSPLCDVGNQFYKFLFKNTSKTKINTRDLNSVVVSKHISKIHIAISNFSKVDLQYLPITVLSQNESMEFCKLTFQIRSADNNFKKIKFLFA